MKKRITKNEKVIIDGDNAWLLRSELFNIREDLKMCIETASDRKKSAYTKDMYAACNDAQFYLVIVKFGVESAIKALWRFCKKSGFTGEALNQKN